MPWRSYDFIAEYFSASRFVFEKECLDYVVESFPEARKDCPYWCIESFDRKVVVHFPVVLPKSDDIYAFRQATAKTFRKRLRCDALSVFYQNPHYSVCIDFRRRPPAFETWGLF